MSNTLFKLKVVVNKNLTMLFWRIWRAFHFDDKKANLNSNRYIIIPADTISIVGSRGDEAMFMSIVGKILEKSPEAEIFVGCSHEPAVLLCEKKGLGVMPLWGGVFCAFKMARFIKKIRPANAYVMGADIMDGWYSIILSMRMIIVSDVMKKCGVETKYLGFSLNEGVKKPVADAFRMLDKGVVVNLRDPVSFRRFQKICPGRGNLVADMAFLTKSKNVDHVDVEVIDWINQEKSKGNTVFGINIHPLLFQYDVRAERSNNLVEALGSALLNISKIKKVSVLLIPHDDRDSVGDEVIMRKLYEHIANYENLNCKLWGRVPHADELRPVIKKLDFVFTGRLHLAIATLSEGVFPVLLEYQGKFMGVLEHFRLPEWLLVKSEDICDDKILENVIIKSIDESDIINGSVRNRLPYVVALSNKTFI